MRRTAILEATRPPRGAVSYCRVQGDKTFAQPATGSASMHKFGEYVFLEDSRYARQAKSARALPLGASARPGVTRMRLRFPPAGAPAPRARESVRGFRRPRPRGDLVPSAHLVAVRRPGG